MNRSALLTVSVAFSFLGAACDGPEAPPPASYDVCAENADCVVEGDTCIPLFDADDEEIGRECTRECTADADCPSAGRCFSVGGEAATCHHACGAGTDCRNGWGCQAQADGRGICLPGPSTPTGIAIFDVCPLSTFPGPCAADVDGCYLISHGGGSAALCTNSCSEERRCPIEPESKCLSFNGIDFNCFESCEEDDSVCPTGLTCIDELADGTTIAPVCLPTPAPPVEG